MTVDNSIALVLLALLLTGCQNTGYKSPPLGWEQPNMQILGDQGWRSQVHCGKRGCHQEKPLLFDPSKAEPGVNSMHRGW
ncbi:hypothetical protein [Pseudomonas fontis]|uniref:Lipoprotein n=1 Tax=Pseudomonas fontis TaxID=2942633 RepID=A0ABT5P1M0_9PSED|nr:hypothetical protein [Pseudomonas fontis]MDD0974116.1 hypothetical protein [Pseudomonas fontis]MDD0994188.1 hypothetical protein [Pseudomonas fontis]